MTYVVYARAHASTLSPQLLQHLAPLLEDDVCAVRLGGDNHLSARAIYPSSYEHTHTRKSNKATRRHSGVAGFRMTIPELRIQGPMRNEET